MVWVDQFVSGRGCPAERSIGNEIVYFCVIFVWLSFCFPHLASQTGGAGEEVGEVLQRALTDVESLHVILSVFENILTLASET